MIHFLQSQPANALIEGETIPIQSATNFNVQILWVGACNGTVKLQWSNNGINWSDIPDSSQATGGISGSHSIDYDSAGFEFVRVVYTHTSGIGVIAAIGNIKQPTVSQM